MLLTLLTMTCNTSGMTQTASSTASDLLTVLQALGQIFLNFGLPMLVLLGLYLGYRAIVAKLDREVEVRALQAVARRRVERRKNAAARNLDMSGSYSREVAKR